MMKSLLLRGLKTNEVWTLILVCENNFMTASLDRMASSYVRNNILVGTLLGDFSKIPIENYISFAF